MSPRLKRLLCRVGVHSWRKVNRPFSGGLRVDTICEDCQKDGGRKFYRT